MRERRSRRGHLSLLLLALAAAATGCGYAAIGGFLGYDLFNKKKPSPFTIPSPTPTPVSVLTPTTIQLDRVPISYSLGGTSSFDVRIEYSTSGAAGPFFTATESVGSPSEGTKSLSSSAAGTPHVFVWNSFWDLDNADIHFSGEVVIRVSAIPVSTTAVFGKPGTSAPFTVDNRLMTVVVGSSGQDV